MSSSLNNSDYTKEKIQLIVDALDDKRALDIRVFNLMDVSDSLSYFIIASGESSIQIKAMQDNVKEILKEKGHQPLGIEGPSERWVLMDYGETLVHLMNPEARSFYDLEGLWADATLLDVVASPAMHSNNSSSYPKN